MTVRTSKRSAGEPTWFDLATSNLAVAKEFYKQVFGWDYFDTGADFANYNFAMVNGHNAAGMGPIWPPDSPQPSAWTVYFASDDAAADAQQIKALGGQVVVEPMTIPESGVMVIAVDPTGAAFGLWQTINHIGSAVENEHGGIGWCEVNTRDATAACEFYSNLLHVEISKMEGIDFFMMQRGKDMLAGIQQMDASWDGIPPHWLCYFVVDNTDAAIERAVTAGGKVTVPAFDMPHGRMAILNDPTGAVFSIVQPLAA